VSGAGAMNPANRGGEKEKMKKGENELSMANAILGIGKR